MVTIDKKGFFHDSQGLFTDKPDVAKCANENPNLNSAIGKTKENHLPNQTDPTSKEYAQDMKMKDLKKFSGVAAGLALASALTGCASNATESGGGSEVTYSGPPEPIQTQSPEILNVNVSTPSDLQTAEVTTEMGAVFTTENDAVAARAQLSQMSFADPAREGKWVVQRTDDAGKTYWEIVKDDDYAQEIADLPAGIIPAWNTELSAIITGLVIAGPNSNGEGAFINWQNPNDDFLRMYVDYMDQNGTGDFELGQRVMMRNVIDGMSDAEWAYVQAQGWWANGHNAGGDSNVTLIHIEQYEGGYSSPVWDNGNTGVKPKSFQTKAAWVEYWTKIADQHRDNPSFVVWGPDGRL